MARRLSGTHNRKTRRLAHAPAVVEPSVLQLTVKTFAFEVEKPFTFSPEQDQRRTSGFVAGAHAVREPELGATIPRSAAFLV